MTNNPTIDGVSLLPCPFCGEVPVLTKHFRDESYSFMHRCSVLGPLSMGFREDPKSHEAVWNTRSTPEVAALQSTIAQLQARVQELESGRGVVAAYRIQHQDGYWCTWGSGPVSEGDLQDVADGVISGIEFAYSSPPAPVAAGSKLEMAQVVRAHMEIPNCPVLTSNQCHALAVKLNACLDATAALNKP